MVKMDIFREIFVHKLHYHFLAGGGQPNDNMGEGDQKSGNDSLTHSRVGSETMGKK